MSSVHHPINVLWALALIFLLAVPVALPYGSLLDARPSNRQLLKDEWDASLTRPSS
jgi:hypothetical protein